MLIQIISGEVKSKCQDVESINLHTLYNDNLIIDFTILSEI